MLAQLLKPKDKADVLDEIKHSNVEYSNFNRVLNKYKKLYGEELPKEFYPFNIKIKDDLAHKGYLQRYSDHFIIKKTKVYICRQEKTVNLLMFPVRKIKELESIRIGNMFLINNFEQYKIIINFLENN